MSVTLTTAIVIPNVTRWRVSDVQLFDSASRAIVRVVFANAGQTRRREFAVSVGNGTSDSLVKNATPTDFASDVQAGPTVTTATGYDTIEAAYRGGGTKAAAYRAVESALLTLGVVAADLGGTVT